MQRLGLWLVILVLLTLSVSTANAQTNLLRDPGFEGESYKNVAIDPADANTRFNVPVDWEGWFSLTPHTADWMNIYPNGFPQIGWPRRSGNRAINISRGQATFTVALYQRVSVTTGTNVQGGGWAYNENSTGTARAGIDPNGGTNPYDSDIVWGNTVSGPNSNFFQSSVDATATGDTVTLWLFATQSSPSDPNGVYWDDAYVYVGGGGGAVAGTAVGTPVSGVPVVPTSAPPAVAGFVNPQAPQADGSIIHVVQTGDTLASIAFAYGITLEQLQLQNNISNPRFISVGQRLIIRAADDEDAAVAEEDDPPADDATAAPTNEGDSEPAPTAEDAAPAPTNAPPVVAVAPTDAAPAPVRQGSEDGLDPSQTTSTLCVVMFEDSNQNRLQEAGEGLLADGTIALTDGTETIADETTDDSAEICFDDIVAGSYVAAGSAPDGYGLTTPDQLQVRVFPGETLYLAFGAAQGVEVATAPTADSQISSQTDDETAPLTPETRIDSPVNMLIDNSGLIVFGLAGIVMIFGVGVTMFGLMRRR